VSAELPLVQKIASLAEALRSAGIPFAFGGAIALGFHAEPRATLDIDVNLFVAEGEARRVLSALAAVGITCDREAVGSAIERDGQVRIAWGTTPLDLFFAHHALHESCRARARLVPFAGARIPVLSAEDLVVFKALFARTKDWADVESIVMARGDDLDRAYVERWLAGILPPGDSRLVRLREALGEVAR
jgi:hypothetical protein